MSGIDFRGRRRFRDSEATERLTALLRETCGEAVLDDFSLLDRLGRDVSGGARPPG